MTKEVKAYRVKVSVKNNLLLNAIEEHGYKSVAEFSRAIGASHNSVGEIIAMRTAPIANTGGFTALAKKIMEALGAAPTDLWTAEQLNMRLRSNSAERVVDAEGIQAALGAPFEWAALPSPEEHMFNKERALVLDAIAEVGLTAKEREVIKKRFYEDVTLEDCAQVMGLTKERIRQIEGKALRKFRYKWKNALEEAALINNDEFGTWV